MTNSSNIWGEKKLKLTSSDVVVYQMFSGDHAEMIRDMGNKVGQLNLDYLSRERPQTQSSSFGGTASVVSG